MPPYNPKTATLRLPTRRLLNLRSLRKTPTFPRTQNHRDQRFSRLHPKKQRSPQRTKIHPGNWPRRQITLHPTQNLESTTEKLALASHESRSPFEQPRYSFEVMELYRYE